MTNGEASPVKQVSGPSLTARARLEISQAIIEGRFKDGRLPPEDELASHLGVSRTTVRSALQALERDGLITRRRGLGTLVKPHLVPYRLGLHRLVGFDTLLAEQGHKPSVNIAVKTAQLPTDEWMERLKISDGAECVLLEKLFRAGGRPAIAILDVVPVASLRAQPSGREIPAAIFEFFHQYGHGSVDHAVVEILPRDATTAVARRLRIKPGQAHLHLIETHYSVSNEPLALSYIDVNDAYVRFDMVRQHQ